MESFQVNDDLYVRGQPGFEDGVRSFRWIIGFMIAFGCIPLALSIGKAMRTSVGKRSVESHNTDQVNEGRSGVPERRNL
jgi:hypothetical protein